MSRIPEIIKFEDSYQNNFIQIADLCAYCVMRQARDFKTFDGGHMYKGYKWIYPIMHRDPISRKVTNFGAVFFP